MKTFWGLFCTMYLIAFICMGSGVPYNPYGFIWTGLMGLLVFCFYILFNRTPKKPLVVPEEGRQIKITWFPHCKNVPSHVTNPYISMEGIVREVNPDGSFKLECKTAWLIVSNVSYKFEYTDGKE